MKFIEFDDTGYIYHACETMGIVMETENLKIVDDITDVVGKYYENGNIVEKEIETEVNNIAN